MKREGKNKEIFMKMRYCDKVIENAQLWNVLNDNLNSCSLPFFDGYNSKMNSQLDWERIIQWSHTETTYLLRVVVSPEQLELQLQDKFTGDLWHGVYLSHAIEELTEKAKNKKRYSVFVNMLRSALQKNKENLFIEVLSYRQIMIRTRANSTTVPQEHASKRFLILNYNLQFEKIQFPIPIKHYADAPPERLKLTIKRLAQDASNYRNERSQSDLERENAYLKYELDSLKASKKNNENSEVLKGKFQALQKDVNEKNIIIEKLNNNAAQLQKERKLLLEKLAQSQERVQTLENHLKQKSTITNKQSQGSKASEQKLEQLITKMKKLADDLIFAQQKQKKSQIKISTLQKQLQNMQKNQQQRTTVRYKEDRDRQRNDSPLSRSEKQLSVKSGRSNKSNKSNTSKKNISSIIKNMKGTANPNINYKKYSNKKSSVYDSDTQSSRMRKLNNGRSSPYRQTTNNLNNNKNQKQRSRSKSRQKVVSPKPSNIVQSQMYSQAFQSDDSEQRFQRLQRQIKTVKGKPQASRKTASRVTGVSKQQNIQNKLQSLQQMIRRAAMSTKQR